MPTDLHHHLVSAIHRGFPVADFSHSARQLFSHQFQNNSGYRAYCESLSLTPESVSSWQEIPCLTTDTFKQHPNPSCLAQAEITHTFLTSGTTGETRGEHHFATTQLYEASLLKAWDLIDLPPLHPHTFILTPPPTVAPNSSLVHMLETLRLKHNPQASYLIHGDSLETAPLIAAAQNGHPITLLGTALAMLNLCEQLAQPLILPAHSWAMETGGYKGSGRTLDKAQLYQQFFDDLGLPASSIWNEYSMTELSSQCYTRGLGSPHHSPPWMKIRVIDPETNQVVLPSELGYLCLYDLANYDSVLAIRTQDLAIYHDEHSFTLIGRDPAALPRGCSRSIDEALQQPRSS